VIGDVWWVARYTNILANSSVLENSLSSEMGRRSLKVRLDLKIDKQEMRRAQSRIQVNETGLALVVATKPEVSLKHGAPGGSDHGRAKIAAPQPVVKVTVDFSSTR
jgi:hypothetical protein